MQLLNFGQVQAYLSITLGGLIGPDMVSQMISLTQSEELSGSSEYHPIRHTGRFSQFRGYPAPSQIDMSSFFIDWPLQTPEAVHIDP